MLVFLLVVCWICFSASVHDQPSGDDYKEEQDKQQGASLLIIATVPQSNLHVQALWTILQCMSVGYDHVVLSGPRGARAILMETMKLMRHLQVHPNVHLLLTSENDRYDVGLWCDALDMVEEQSPLSYKYITLINDSIMILRHTRAVMDALETRRYDLVGMSYSHTGGSFWIESYVRGFSKRGIQAFRQHSCTKEGSHSSFRTKRKVVDFHEIGLMQYFRERPDQRQVGAWQSDNKINDTMVAVGLYPGDHPDGWVGRGDANRTWVASFNLPFWKRVLLKGQLFPLAKVKMPQMIAWATRHYPECKLPKETIKSLPPPEFVMDKDWSWERVFAATGLSD